MDNADEGRNVDSTIALALADSGAIDGMATHQPSPVAENPPIKPKISVHSAFAIDMRDKSTLNKRLAQETRGHYVGPMPLHEFVDQFMPWNTNNQKYLVDALSGWPVDDFKVAETIKRKLMQCFIDLKDTHSHRDVACASLGVDYSAYNVRKGPRRVTRSRVRTMDFVNLDFFAEDKGSDRSDAFVDPPGDEYTHQGYFRTDVVASVEDENEQFSDADLDSDEEEDLDVPATYEKLANVIEEVQDEQTVEEVPKSSPDYPFESHMGPGIDTRGQIACHVGVTMAVQFRLHMFSILLCGRYARFIRWDRSAAIASRRFDFVDNPRIVFDFFKRYAQLTHAQRVFDPGVSLATKQQGIAARRQLRKFALEYWCGRALDLPQERIVKNDARPFVCWISNGKRYIVPAPLCDTECFSPFGRVSRGRLVYELGGGKLRYLKDSWREDSPYTKPEAEIYRLLEEKGVEYVARMSDGGDTGHQTVGHEYKSCTWVSQNKGLRVQHLYGHIVALVDIGRDIETFKTAHQLVTCLADAMEGHKQALEKAGVLHRDISTGNIMMTWDPDNRRGFSLTGTTILFRSLSRSILESDALDERVPGNRESAFHVLMWMTLSFLPHTLRLGELRRQLGVFDAYDEEDGFAFGSDTRIQVRPHLGFRGRLEPVGRFISQLNEVFRVRYDEFILRLEELIEKLNSPTWLIQTLREAAQQLPNDDERDWTDYQAKVMDDQLNRKRKQEDYSELPRTKRSKQFDGLHTSDLSSFDEGLTLT
ncbi:hypothetical protein AX16_004166 [Volvariella volvacea WC 439]|nr:hypothetical protein AX16_004166 [Volvariella volvacea WC 439]